MAPGPSSMVWPLAPMLLWELQPALVILAWFQPSPFLTAPLSAKLSVWWSVQGKLYTQFTSRRLFQGCVKSGKKLRSRYNLHARKHNHLPHIQTACVESFRCSLYSISIHVFSSPFFSQFGPTDIDSLAKVGVVLHCQSTCQNPKKRTCMTAHEKIG